MALFLYNLFLKLYSAGIGVASAWNKKARLWKKGRKEQNIPVYDDKTVWMHCSSLGEFEQGRPVLEAVKSRYPQYRIVLTFFSPSGYEVRKNYTEAHSILYLPLDGKKNAKDFIKAINPGLVIWIKYEYWFHYLHQLKKQNIPVLLVSGIFRDDQPFFKWYGSLWKKMLSCFRHFFVQNGHSLQLLQESGFAEVTLTGDTRFDRVADIASRERETSLIKEFCGNAKVIVAGSTWEEDEEVLIHYAKANAGIKFIIAPHEVDEGNIKDVKKEFSNSVLFSQLNPQNLHHQVLIIDNIGMLSYLYRYATAAYVGGGFRSGIHNILEAAVYYKPVVFGPVHEKFDEARALLESGGAYCINTALELEKTFDELLSDEKNTAGKTAGEFIYKNRGATEKIMNFIQANRLLTS